MTVRFGGGYRFLLGDGTVLTGRKDKIDVKPSGYKATIESNADGSTYQTLELVPTEADCAFQDDGQDWQAVALYRGDITVQEDTTGRTHTFTGAAFEGSPSINRRTGEVSGLTVKAPSGGYKAFG